MLDFEKTRTLIIGIGSALLAFLAPLAGDLLAMLVLFAANALFGVIADIVDGKSWNKHKLKTAFVEALLFFAFVFLIHGIGYLKGNMQGALQCVSFISYTLIYYYGTNIARNMMNILPDGSLGHKAFSFIYYVLSVEFIRRLPFLAPYLKGASPLEASQEPPTPQNS